MIKSEIDILIPVFNEDETIILTIKNIMSDVKYNYRVLICYDYDEDPTLKIIKKNFPNNSKIIFVKNYSKGFNTAIISGFKISSASAVIVFMADDHINHNLINLCYKKFNEGYDIVCPSRFVKGGKMIGNPILKASLTRLVSFFYIILLLFQLKILQTPLDYFQKKLLIEFKLNLIRVLL